MAYSKKHAQFSAAWTRIQKEGCDPVWNDYGNFRDWSELRWAEGATLEKIFPELPWSPDNAFWLRDCQYFRQKTNADRIRAMSDEELTMVIMCPRDIGHKIDTCIGESCKDCSIRWLQEPSKEEGE